MPRYDSQWRLVLAALSERPRRWLTLAYLSRVTGAPEASVSAQIRNLRKVRYGSREVRRRYRPSEGKWEYRLC